MSESNGTVRALAIKPAHGAPMEDATEVEVTISEGVVGNVEQSSYRRVTLLSEELWADVQQEAGAELPWHTRRANILTAGVDLPSLTGKTVRVGDVELNINGETKPCNQMDDAHYGLQAIMKPEWRGGVYGSVQRGGAIKVGDSIVIAD